MNAETVSNCARIHSKNYSELRLRYKPLKQRIHVAVRKVEPRPHSAENVELSSNGLLIPFCQSDKLPPVKERDFFWIRCECGSETARGRNTLVDCCPLLEIRCFSERSKWHARRGSVSAGRRIVEECFQHGTITKRLRGWAHYSPRRVCMI